MLETRLQKVSVPSKITMGGSTSNRIIGYCCIIMGKNGFKTHPEFHLHFLCLISSFFQPTPGHFTCPLHKQPLPCSTFCWALYHSCPFPSAASQPWAPLFQKQAAVARGHFYLPRLGEFHMALLEKAPVDQVILGTFPGALSSRQQEKVSLHFPASE